MKNLLISATILCQLCLLIACAPSASVYKESVPKMPPAPIGLPVIDSFSASPSSISTGDSATLNWSVTDATSVYISPGIGTVDSTGSTIVSPQATTTYILAASNTNGVLTGQALVQVSSVPSTSGSPPVIKYFTASPTVVLFGSSTLAWDVSNALQVSINQGIGNVESMGNKSVSVKFTTSYTLTASNRAGTVHKTITVTPKHINR
jgi:hypothetical protein